MITDNTQRKEFSDVLCKKKKQNPLSMEANEEANPEANQEANPEANPEANQEANQSGDPPPSGYAR